METIKVECTGAGELALSLLTPMQGELKTLSDENYEKLKKEILVDGFSYPIAVWENKDDGIIYILDGHQRYHVLEKMKKEGYQIPQIPVVFVVASDYQQAKRKLLAAASQYGNYNHEGFLKFVGTSMDFTELATSFNFPGMDMDFLMEQMNGQMPDVNTVSVTAHDRQLSDGSLDSKDIETQVRMVQLFLNGKTHPDFMRMCMKLQETWGTINLTDTVLKAVNETFNNLKT